MNKKKKILIFGGSGLLGLNFVRKYNQNYEILATYFSNKPPIFKNNNIKFIKLNIQESVSKIILKLKGFKPNYVFNFSGISEVDVCEKNKKRCKKVIYLGLKKISKIAKKFDIPILHISTDSVYDIKNKSNTEKSNLLSQNYYSELKIKCEKHIIKNHKKYIIIRTRFFGFSMTKKNFFEKILLSAKKNKKIYCYKNIYSTPISVNNLSEIIHKLVNYNINGTFNISTDKKISRYEFARQVCRVFKLRTNIIIGTNYSFEEKNIKKIQSTNISNKKIKKYSFIKIENLSKSLLKLKNEKKNYSYSAGI